MIDPKGFTVSDLETHKICTRRAADGVLAYLREKNFVVETGEERKKEGAKGRGSTLFQVADALPVELKTAFFE